MVTLYRSLTERMAVPGAGGGGGGGAGGPLATEAGRKAMWEAINAGLASLGYERKVASVVQRWGNLQVRGGEGAGGGCTYQPKLNQKQRICVPEPSEGVPSAQQSGGAGAEGLTLQLTC